MNLLSIYYVRGFGTRQEIKGLGGYNQDAACTDFAGES